MSGSVSISQTGIPAQIAITPGPGVAFSGVGAPGLGFLNAALDSNGHIQVLRSDGVTIDAGKAGPVVARVAAGGSNGALDATPLLADVSLVLAAVPTGAVVLQPGFNQSRKVVNKLAAPLPVYPPPGAAIDQLAPGAPMLVAAGTTETFHSPDGVSWTAE